MRFLTTLLALATASVCLAQRPAFSTEARRAALPPAAERAVGEEFRDFQALRFDAGALADYLAGPRGAEAFDLRLGGDEYVVQLRPRDVRGDDYALYYADDDGVHLAPRRDNIVYHGYTVGAKPAEVSLAIDEGFVYGMIAEGADALFFQSLSLTVPAGAAAPDDLLLFRGSDGVLPAENACGMDASRHAAPGHRDRGAQADGHDDDHAAQRAVGQCLEVDLAIANDFLMYQSYSSNITTLENRNLGVVATVNTDYAGNFADDYIFVVSEQFVATSAAADPWTSSTDASALLSSFRQWGAGGFSAPFDLGSLWTNRNLAGSTIGIAYLGAVCTSFKYNVLEDFSSNADLTRVLVSHEYGHNFDCDHDASGSPFIMAPAVQFTSSWSAASVNFVDAFGATRTCLSVDPSCSGGGGGGATPPTAAFAAGQTSVCEGATVVFGDQSTGATAWQWSFPGGSPATSTAQNPQVSYATAGTYDVTLTVSNSAGQDTRTETDYITVAALPIAGFSVFTTATPNEIDFFNTSVNAQSFFWNFGDGFTSTASDPTHFYANPGSYTVTLTASNSCGSATTTQQVNIVVPPIAAFINSDPVGCDPHTVQFDDRSTGVRDAFLWDFPGGTPSSSTLPDPVVTYSTPGTYDVTLTVTNSAGSDTEVKTDLVVISASPVAGFAQTVNGNTVAITDQSLNGTTVTYDFGDGVGTSNQPNPTYTYAATGTYTITQTVTNACGLVTTAATVSVQGPPQASFSVDAEFCLGEQVTVTSTTQGAVTSLLYEVTLPDGSTQTSTSDPYVFVVNDPGSYDVSLTAANASGANTATQTGAFVVFDDPTASFTFAANQLTATFAGSVAPVLTGATPSYVWDFGDGNAGQGANPAHTYASSGTYTVTLTALNGCASATASQQITVGNVPSATITAAGANGLCAGDQATFTANVNGTVTSLAWTFTGATQVSQSGNAITLAFPNPGSYQVSVEVCNALGCNTATYAPGVDVGAASASGFAVAQPGGLQVALTDQSQNANSVTYDFGDGTGASSAPNPSYTYAAAGSYTITQTVVGPCGTDVSSQTVTVGQAPVAGFGVSLPSGVLCPGTTIEFVDQSSGAQSFQWSFPGGQPATSTAANPSVTYAQAGTYDATLTVTNGLGSSTTTQQAVVSIQPAPTADFTQVVAALRVDFASQSLAATSFAWTFGDGAQSTDENPVHTYAQSGTYTVTLVATGPCGSDTFARDVTVLGAPTASFQATSATQGCPGLTVGFDASASAGAASYRWSFPGGNPAAATGPTPDVTYAQAGTFDVTLTVTNASGTDAVTRSGLVVVLPDVAAGFTANTTMLTVAFADTSTGATLYQWDFGDGGTSTDASPTYTYAAAGTYTVTLTATGACGSDTETQTVTVAPGLPSAAIDVIAGAGCAPFAASFSAAGSVDADAYAWTFPGGTPASSAAVDPSVTYAAPGSYDVQLVVSNATGADTLLLAGAVTVGGAPGAALQVPIVTGFDVAFEVNTTDPAATVAWDFGDGTVRDPGSRMETHTYAATGQYDVVVSVANACGIDRDTVEVLVGAVPDAEFEASVREGCGPLDVTLTDISTGGPTAWLWTVTGPQGTSAQTSSDRMPTFTLTAPGFYTVSLRATNAVGSATEVRQRYLEVLADPTATAQLLGVDALTASFASAMTAADSLVWDFGDGATSMALMPVHTYASAGSYAVVLSAFGPCGVARDTVTVTVRVSGVDGLPAGAELSLFPNPAESFASWSLTGVASRRLGLRVVDATGRTVFEQRLGGGTSFRAELPVAEWPAGTYVVEWTGDTFAARRPLVVQ